MRTKKKVLKDIDNLRNEFTTTNSYLKSYKNKWHSLTWSVGSIVIEKILATWGPFKWQPISKMSKHIKKDTRSNHFSRILRVIDCNLFVTSFTQHAANIEAPLKSILHSTLRTSLGTMNGLSAKGEINAVTLIITFENENFIGLWRFLSRSRRDAKDSAIKKYFGIQSFWRDFDLKNLIGTYVCLWSCLLWTSNFES